MFALRNIAGSRLPDTEKAAVEALATGFSDDSELFKYKNNVIYNLLIDTDMSSPLADTRSRLYSVSSRRHIRFQPF